MRAQFFVWPPLAWQAGAGGTKARSIRSGARTRPTGRAQSAAVTAGSSQCRHPGEMRIARSCQLHETHTVIDPFAIPARTDSLRMTNGTRI